MRPENLAVLIQVESIKIEVEAMKAENVCAEMVTHTALPYDEKDFINCSNRMSALLNDIIYEGQSSF